MIWFFLGIVVGYALGYHRARADVKRAMFFLQDTALQMRERWKA